MQRNHQDNSNTTRFSAWRASKELADMVVRYNQTRDPKIDPTLNELIYVVVRLADSIRQDQKHANSGWTELVREVRRRLFGHLNSGHGFQQSAPPDDQAP